jgi:Ribbon-helix-helix protein, copG family
MLSMGLVQVRVGDDVLAELDQLATEHECTRSEIVRRALAAYAADPVAPAAGSAVDLNETIVLLSDRARDGVVAAQTALLRHLAQRERANGGAPRPEDDPLFEVDQVAARRLRGMAEDPDDGGEAA